MINTHAEPGTPIRYRLGVSMNRDCRITAERMKEYGLHPMCEACPTRLAGECAYPQYNARNLLLFECSDFR